MYIGVKISLMNTSVVYIVIFTRDFVLRQVRNLHQWIGEAWKLMTVHKTHEIISTYNIKKEKVRQRELIGTKDCV